MKQAELEAAVAQTAIAEAAAHKQWEETGCAHGIVEVQWLAARTKYDSARDALYSRLMMDDDARRIMESQ